MRPVLSRERMRAFDRHAIEACAVPSLVLMENAGRGAAERIRACSSRAERVLVVCGRGNNGGDGFVVARQLSSAGYTVEVALLSGPNELTPDAAANAAAWRGIGGAAHEVTDPSQLEPVLSQARVVVDAIFGTGLTRPLDGAVKAVVELVNASSRRVFALDIPSGIDANTGAVLGHAVRAERTLTFGHYKLGAFTSLARPFVGELEVVDLGVPGELWRSVGADAQLSELADVQRLLRQRPRSRHKGDSGRVLVIAGGAGSVGAARLCAHGALRAGAGLVKVATFERAARALEAGDYESMTTELDPQRFEETLDPWLEWASAIVVGPGLGTAPPVGELCERVLARARVPVVVDADGLNVLRGRPEVLATGARVLLTPHPAEAGRLLGVDTAAVEGDRFAAVRRLAERTRAVALLKGEHSLVAGPSGDEPTVVNSTGGPLLAVGGSGDVLSGVLAALCCHLTPREAAIAGAWLHGRAADELAGQGFERGVLARELGDLLPKLMVGLAHEAG